MGNGIRSLQILGQDYFSIPVNIFIMRFILLMLYLFWFSLTWQSCSDREPLVCRNARKIHSKPKIEGIISNKYETDNLRYQVLEINHLNPENRKLYLAKGIHQDFFDYVSINDTIRKDSNSLTYHIKKANGKKRSFFLHYGCPDSLSLPR